MGWQFELVERDAGGDHGGIEEGHAWLLGREGCAVGKRFKVKNDGPGVYAWGSCDEQEQDSGKVESHEEWRSFKLLAIVISITIRVNADFSERKSAHGCAKFCRIGPIARPEGGTSG